ncbi:MAG: hypothetical protein ACTHJQ_12555 [Rhizobiaceae bacterium]
MKSEIRFKATEKTESLMPTIRKTMEAWAFDQANEFITAGQTAREATSIVANIMIQIAWVVAASGAVSEDVTPDKDKFRSSVENTLDSIQFKDRAA